MFFALPIVNTSAEYDNYRFFIPHEVTLPLIIHSSLIILSGGILANIFVLYLSFYSPSVTGNFKYFTANLAFCDLCFNLSVCGATASQMYHDYNNVPYTTRTCFATIAFPMAFLSSICFAMPLTATNRFIVIVMRREDLYTKPRVFLLCACSYLALIVLPIDFLFAPYVVNFIFDSVFIIYTPYVGEAFLYEAVLLCVPLLCFSTVRVYRLLSKHISVLSAELNKTPEQIRAEKSILKAIIIQALTPVICALPLCSVIVILAFHGFDWNVVSAELTIFRYGENNEYSYTMVYLAASFGAIFAILDPFITLLIVKGYRKAASQFFAKFKICNKVTAKAPDNVTTLFQRRTTMYSHS